MLIENIRDLIPLESEKPQTPEAPVPHVPSEWEKFVEDHFGKRSQILMEGFTLRQIVECEVRAELSVAARSVEREVCRAVIWQNLKQSAAAITREIEEETAKGWAMTPQKFWDRIFSENHRPCAVLPLGALAEGRARVGV